MELVGFLNETDGNVLCVDCQKLWPGHAFRFTALTPDTEEIELYQCDGECGRTLDQVESVTL